MTILLAVILIAGFSSVSNAQISIGAKAGIAMPMGDFGDGYNMGFGGVATGEYSLNDNMSLGLNIGFYTFGGKDLPSGVTASFNVIPIIADFKYYFQTEGFIPYAGLGLGLHMQTSKYSASIIDVSTSESNFAIIPKAGFWMGDDFKWGASLEYNIVSFAENSVGHLGINVGILYPLGK